MSNSNFIQILYQTFVERADLIKVGIQEHLILVLFAMFFAIIIAVPLGVFLTNYKKLAEPIIGIVAVVQTIPSLALLGFMLPLVGIGKTNAIIALTAYALLPVLRNTYTGISEVDPSTIEAGKGMGMKRWQILGMIQIPLALPVIMAGIRTSTVITIGTATLATFVGAGGLGNIIYRGITMQNTQLILAGAIPAALFAIITDFILKKFEIKVTPQGIRS
ncbi:ABC transporter permease [Anaerovorax sp. IOR16]|uniref:ABC transporter permease n=1 Tax=Anaerovorax sp. IOR16 TaxID=2773458 RepID=UPI001FD66D77|nr:ABC transporter permease [Anaerovorax sp. IOR16]